MTITQEQKDAARRQKADKNKAARAEVAAAKEALGKAGLEFTHKSGTLTIEVDGTALTPEQKRRAATYTAGHAGLMGKALAAYILEGKTLKEQTADAQAAITAAAKAERTRKNLTRSSDPEAKELAVAAAELVPDVVSTFRPKNARELLDTFKVEVPGAAKDADIKVTRTGAQGAEGALEEAVFADAALKAFVQNAEMDAEAKAAVRKQISGLAKGTGLWGRKLAALIYAKAHKA
jgi:hypothetical protein